ncbi:TraR/DksA C4-type zinc finger protein [Pueribacillus theae]|nr:TraR/DksA C4-type zinc finger protein [Pueribacillus theae]
MALTAEQLQQFNQTLLEMKKETETLLKSSDHFGTEEEMIKESMGELSNYDNHPADNGTILFDREKDIALNEHTERELNEINDALERIKNGTYGICEDCKQDIPIERLEAHPTAARCVEHSRDQTVAKQRPVEEQILEPPFGNFEGFENDENENTSYDSEDAWQDVAKWGTSDTPSDLFDNEIKDYNDMYLNSDERVGYVEDIESLVATNRYGKNRKVLPNDKHEEYEERE